MSVQVCTGTPFLGVSSISMVVVMTATGATLGQEPLRLLHEQLPLPLDIQQVFECLPYVQYIILVLILILLIPIVLNLFGGMNSFGNPMKGINHFPRIKCP